MCGVACILLGNDLNEALLNEMYNFDTVIIVLEALLALPIQKSRKRCITVSTQVHLEQCNSSFINILLLTDAAVGVVTG